MDIVEVLEKCEIYYVMYYIILYYVMLCYVTLRYVILHYIILYYIILYYIILYYITLYIIKHKMCCVFQVFQQPLLILTSSPTTGMLTQHTVYSIQHIAYS
jgi:hypothetical protein